MDINFQKRLQKFVTISTHFLSNQKINKIMSLKKITIQIQQLNCLNCATRLKKKLSQIKNISFITIHKDSSQISFNYEYVKDVSDVENILTSSGFPPLGEKVESKITEGYFCKDSSNNYCINRFQ